MHTHRWLPCLALMLFAFTAAAWGALNENQVLVLYNSQAADGDGNGQSDSLDVFHHYQSWRPGVLGYDLNDPTLSAGNLSYADYVTRIRNPLRAHLTANGLEQQIVVFTLTLGLPHRIQDINDAELGDSVGGAVTAWDAGNATFAAIDSELTLLWQPLETGEANGSFDSKTDNVVSNPFHNATSSISSFDRSAITSAKRFRNLFSLNTAWQMRDGLGPQAPITDAGNLYLTARLDGNSLADVRNLIDRAQYASYLPTADAILLDENQDGELDNSTVFAADPIGHLGDDLDETSALLAPKYANLYFNENQTFLVGGGPGYSGTAPSQVVSDPIAVLASYGANHDSGTGNNRGYLESFGGQFLAGSIMNTVESFNAKSFGGLGGFGEQGQLSRFAELGGTFGVGNVWEPLASSLADNEVLLENFLFGGQTWVEAAWASIPWISWQQLVLGDPLATATLISDPQPAVWNGTDAAAGSPGDGVTWDDAENWTRGGVADALIQPGDSVTFVTGSSLGVAVLGSAPTIVESLEFQDSYRLGGGWLAIRSGVVSVSDGVTAEFASPVVANGPLRKQGAGTLAVQGTAPHTIVEDGTLTGSGSVAALDVLATADVAPGQGVGVLQVAENFRVFSGAQVTVEVGDNLLSQPISDQLQVGATAELAGRLDVVPRAGYTDPVVRGQQEAFPFLSAVSRIGTFDQITYAGAPLDTTFLQGNGSFRSHVDDGLFRIANYTATGLDWTHYLALEGDANGDGLVIASTDGAALLAHLAMPGLFSWIDGDFDNDGLVTASNDGGILLSGLVVDRASARAVPEPASWAIAICGWAVLACTRLPLRRLRRDWPLRTPPAMIRKT